MLTGREHEDLRYAFVRGDAVTPLAEHYQDHIIRSAVADRPAMFYLVNKPEALRNLCKLLAGGGDCPAAAVLISSLGSREEGQTLMLKLRILQSRIQPAKVTGLAPAPAASVKRKRGSAGVADRERIRHRDWAVPRMPGQRRHSSWCSRRLQGSYVGCWWRRRLKRMAALHALPRCRDGGGGAAARRWRRRGALGEGRCQSLGPLTLGHHPVPRAQKTVPWRRVLMALTDISRAFADAVLGGSRIRD